MRRHWIVWISILVLGAPAALWAGPPPKNANFVDPDAPCYRWPAVDYDGDGVFDRIDHCPDTPPGCTVDKWGCESDADGDGVCDGRDQCSDTPSGMKVDKDGCGPNQRAAMQAQREMPREVTPPPPPPPPPTTPPQSENYTRLGGGRIRLENVYFESGSAVMLPESETTLNELGRALEKYPDLNVEIQGHTDTRGSAASNMRLSQARAEAVRDYVLSHFNLRKGSVTAKGYGETRPETKERNEEELLRNRRVEVQALNPEVLPSNVKVEQKP